MLRSMTGYGRGEASSSDITVLVELRSVNNRFRDLQVRCPREYMPLEPRINKVLKEPFNRGRVDAFIRRSVNAGSRVVAVDPDLAGQYLLAIQALRQDVPEFQGQPAPMTFILGQPGVLVVTEAECDVRREWAIVETALRAAVDDLLSMREREGQALYEDLQRHLIELRGCLMQVEDATEGINARLAMRVDTRVRRLLADRIDGLRLAQEAALLADKADIGEEIIRLRSHCSQFAQGLDLDKPVGRRLEFLLQEMHREVNTIGSKAAEHTVSARVVDMKSVLERMREQSANVE